MKKLLIISLFCTSVFSACNTGVSNNAQQPEINDLKERVIAIHDTAMMQMNVLGKLGTQLQERAKGSADSVIYAAAYVETADARQAMMNWMHEFDIPKRSETSEDSVRAYLLKEENKIRKVKNGMFKAREDAEKLLFEKIAPDTTKG